jgi:DTW domain-containing protein YfiP
VEAMTTFYQGTNISTYSPLSLLYMTQLGNSTMWHQKRCEGCWLLANMHCVCHHLVQLPINTKVIVWMHYLEYAKFSGSSTAAMLLKSCANSTLYVYKDDHEQFLKDVAASSGLVVALYPSRDSITVKELRERQRAVEEGFKPIGTPITLIVIDGTWAQAKMMYKSLPPHIIKIRLTEAFQDDYGFLRRHTIKDQVCSYAACVHALEELGESPENIASLRYQLSIKIEGFKSQTHWYKGTGTEFTMQIHSIMLYFSLLPFDVSNSH